MEKEKPFDIFKHWPIVVFTAGLLVTWGIFSNRVANAEAEIKVLQLQQNKLTDTVIDVGKTLVEIKTSLEFIKEKLDNQSR